MIGLGNGRRPTPPAGEAGYSLAMLMILVIVVHIFLAVAMPSWTTFVQREKEKETIFRGLQYAEAIRVFQKRNGRLPVRLEELVEVEPRSIRQLYPNPLHESGEWGLLLQGGAPAAGGNAAPARGVAQRARSGAARAGSGAGAAEADEAPAAQPAAGGRRGGTLVTVPPGQRGDRRSRGPTQQTTGPIAGVYPAASGKSFRKFMEATDYSQWRFQMDMIPVPVVLGDAAPPPRVTSAWIGKPFVHGIQPEIKTVSPSDQRMHPTRIRPGEEPTADPRRFRPGRRGRNQ